MKLIFRYLGRYKKYVFIAMVMKLAGTVVELLLPTIFEHIIDKVVPEGKLIPVLLWGLGMFLTAILCRELNVRANRRAIETPTTSATTCARIFSARR